jgi:exodeoxyribonuclease V alpha subunit
VTLIGQARAVSEGGSVQATGSWTIDRDHGLQFRAECLRVNAPTRTEGIAGTPHRVHDQRLDVAEP